MTYRMSFLETCDGPVGIIHAHPGDLVDAEKAARVCRRISRTLGDLPVIARFAQNNALLFGGPMHLRRFAADANVDALPVVELSILPATSAAA